MAAFMAGASIVHRFGGSDIPNDAGAKDGGVRLLSGALVTVAGLMERGGVRYLFLAHGIEAWIVLS
jgi:hypothetical protein